MSKTDQLLRPPARDMLDWVWEATWLFDLRKLSASLVWMLTVWLFVLLVLPPRDTAEESSATWAANEWIALSFDAGAAGQAVLGHAGAAHITAISEVQRLARVDRVQQRRGAAVAAAFTTNSP
jgi:hypothetical protein